jgi:acetylornithine deacetylase/succinyl-diaminopimelate desuccinylase-like protein
MSKVTNLHNPGEVTIPATTTALPLDDERRQVLDKVLAHLDADRLRELLVKLIEIPSPTGGEREISRFMAAHLTDVVGIDAAYQPATEATGNVHGEVLGSGHGDRAGARLLLYAPIDTHVDPDVDVPTVGKRLREDMVPTARVDGDLVFGLGASNPKCMVAGLTEVVHAVRDAGVDLTGDLALGFAGGGMPWSNSHRDHFGTSSGVMHLLTHGLWPDYCVVLKPKYGVYAEDPGMCWFKVSVYGTFGYAGVTRGAPGFRSSIVPAATVIQEIEQWLPEYTRRNTSSGILPEGWISAVRAGDPDKPAFPSATTEIFLDVRVAGHTTPAEVRHQFGALIADIRDRHPDFEIEWEMYCSIPAGLTAFDNWVIQSAQRGWEFEEQQPYLETALQAGQTDTAIIRALGVPAARVGYPWPPASTPPGFEGLGGMGIASIADLMKGVRVVAYTVVDTLTRTRKELGL